MVTIEILREQLAENNASDLDHRTNSITALEKILPPATARRFLYSDGYDPNLATIKALNDAGFIDVGNFPLTVDKFRTMVSDFSDDELRRFSKSMDGREIGLSYKSLVYLKNGKRDKMSLTEANKFLSAINAMYLDRINV